MTTILLDFELMILDALHSMNPQQKKATLHDKGPAVVFAGAGSGKTRIITYRIALLIENGILPRKILAVTFTNKAAKEMKERLTKITTSAAHVTLGTFHSVCARWLREFAPRLGYTSDFVIYDDDDAKQLIKGLLKLSSTLSEKTVKDYHQGIQKAKTLGFLPDELQWRPELVGQIFPPGGVGIYKKYQESLAQANAMDFNDLLLNVLALLKRDEEVKKILSSRFPYILVDEYQDTNETQFALISHLVGPEKNLFVVGDDDQSIYSWRGAQPSNILHFTEHYKGASVYHLEQNYRSTQNIISSADHLIQHNKTRAPKVLFTENPPGSPISYHKECDNEAESWWVVSKIKEEEALCPFEDVAIFYRTNAQSRIFEDTLRRFHVPYRLYGALRFYDRMEIKDLLAYLRLITNPRDDLAFKRIVNLPPRGIGTKTIEDLALEARNQALGFMEVLPRVKLKGEKKLLQFFELYEELRKDLLSCPLSQVVGHLIKKIDYGDYLKKKHPEDWQDRLSNTHELAAAMADYEEQTDQPSLSLWLSDTSLDSGTEEGEATGVALMTLHAAKGLEFRKVFITGLEEGLIPHNNSLDSLEKIEEERRLLYVGMTRAKEELYLVGASRRRVYNQWNSNPPSRFLGELPKEILGKRREGRRDEKGPEIGVGSQVYHPVYGRGTVKRIESDGLKDLCVVQFADFGLRRIGLKQLRGL
jgi:DNA helicase-2/ATP-dependent DNA helicase PcrA